MIQSTRRLIERGKEGRFKAGVSGNPSGRPKARTLSQASSAGLRKSILTNDPQDRSNAECVAEAIIKLALKGNVPACIELADRVEGKVRQAVTEVDDEFVDKSIEELEVELERSRAERLAGMTDKGTPPDGGYTN